MRRLAALQPAGACIAVQVEAPRRPCERTLHDLIGGAAA